MNTAHFTIDARTVIALGRESIRDTTTAVIELVKNSYDAGAADVEVEILTAPDHSNNELSQIRIADNGSGMSSKEVHSRWLRIGFSAKRGNQTAIEERTPTGEKGIGRLSADRLAHRTILKTKKQRHSAVGIVVDWDDFDKPGIALSDVEVATLSNNRALPSLPRSSKTGTEILLSPLREQWNEADIVKLRKELSLLIPPPSTRRKKGPSFRVNFRSNLAPAYNGVIRPPASDLALVDIFATLDPEDGKLSYEIFDRSSGKRKRASKKTTHINELTQKKVDYAKVGEIAIEYSYFVQKKEILENLNISKADVRTYLREHWGVRIYRDSIRVKPYGMPGSPAADWLSLGRRKARDPSGRRRVGRWRISPNQLVGHIHIGRKTNHELRDSTSREGLIENAAFLDLIEIAHATLRLLERHASLLTQNDNDKSDDQTAANEIEASVSELNEVLEETSQDRDDSDRAEQYEKAKAAAARISKRSRELLDENAIYRTLATLGIFSTVFGHETQTQLTTILGSSKIAQQAMDQSQTSIARRNINKVAASSERLIRWGAFALTRIRYDKRKRAKVDPTELCSNLSSGMLPLFSAASIEFLEKYPKKKNSGYLNPMAFEAVAINLLTNAFAACQRSSKERKVLMQLRIPKSSGGRRVELTVADSGPGIADEFVDEIWKPLFTTQTGTSNDYGGTGLGLSIVDNVVADARGTRTVVPKGRLGGAEFTIALPFPEYRGNK